MTESDYQREMNLRCLAAQRDRRAAMEAVYILADFYEQQGQPSRARLWRESARRHRRKAPPDDLVRAKTDEAWRRKVMMWLLDHIETQEQIARLFKSSPSWTNDLIHQVEDQIRADANWERHRPTLAATVRLQKAGALPPSYESAPFEFGEMPPDSWPRRCAPRKKVA